MIMNKFANYLEFHVCISLSSKCQKFVSMSPGRIYYPLLPLCAINFEKVTTQTRAGLLCIW